MQCLPQRDLEFHNEKLPPFQGPPTVPRGCFIPPCGSSFIFEEELTSKMKDHPHGGMKHPRGTVGGPWNGGSFSLWNSRPLCGRHCMLKNYQTWIHVWKMWFCPVSTHESSVLTSLACKFRRGGIDFQDERRSTWWNETSTWHCRRTLKWRQFLVVKFQISLWKALHVEELSNLNPCLKDVILPSINSWKFSFDQLGLQIPSRRNWLPRWKTIHMVEWNIHVALSEDPEMEAVSRCEIPDLFVEGTACWRTIKPESMFERCDFAQYQLMKVQFWPAWPANSVEEELTSKMKDDPHGGMKHPRGTVGGPWNGGSFSLWNSRPLCGRHCMLKNYQTWIHVWKMWFCPVSTHESSVLTSLACKFRRGGTDFQDERPSTWWN